jgi:hypothetical protein
MLNRDRFPNSIADQKAFTEALTQRTTIQVDHP